MSSTVTISTRGEERIRRGHPWIYRADVVDVQAAAGDIVEVLGPRHRTVGHAFFSDRVADSASDADARRRAG